MNTQVEMSGKIIAASLFGVAIVAFGMWQFFSKDTPPAQSALLTSQDEQPAIDSADSDGDGLKDWEELLLGLNPNDPDSDQDGVGDKEEVIGASARATSTESGAEDLDEEEIAHTDILAREIFGAYIQSKQLGTYDPRAFENIIAQSTQGTFNSNAKPLYTADDIITLTETSEQATSAYETAFQKAIVAVTEIGEYELTTYGRAVETGNEEDFEQLRRASAVYMSIVEDLLAVPVPDDGAVPHLDLINSFAAFARTLDSMAEGLDDPVVAFVSMRDFLEREDAIKAAYAQIDIYFTLKEAEFGV